MRDSKMDKSTNPSDLLDSRSYLDDYKLLCSVNDIFSSFDEHLKICTDLDFDPSELEAEIYTSLTNADKEKIQDITGRLTLWRQVLEKFDSETSVAKLRYYFEKVGMPVT